MSFDLAAVERELAASAQRTEATLARLLPRAELAPERLHAAMRYSTLNGGKRLRAHWVYASGAACAAPAAALDVIAASVEIIHAYSLIHDDLPAMDNDDLRRGKPTCHRAFDEATAILAGDALQALAFELLAVTPELSAERKLPLLKRLGHACGSLGMAGGQAIDLAAIGRQISQAELELMHRRKTGALIEASILMAAEAGELPAREWQQELSAYAAHVGLAFQVWDDVLDVTSDSATLGKTAGKDADQSKPTYPALLGLQVSAAYAQQLADAALTALGSHARFEPLRRIARFVVERRA
jgi:geranylgeranyl pyrophosphate synthase